MDENVEPHNYLVADYQHIVSSLFINEKDNYITMLIEIRKILIQKVKYYYAFYKMRGDPTNLSSIQQQK